QASPAAAGAREQSQGQARVLHRIPHPAARRRDDRGAESRRGGAEQARSRDRRARARAAQQVAGCGRRRRAQDHGDSPPRLAGPRREGDRRETVLAPRRAPEWTQSPGTLMTHRPLNLMNRYPRVSIRARAAALPCLVLGIALGAGAQVPRASWPTEPVSAPRTMVVSASRIASEAGDRVLKSGGNAVDAA